MMKKLSIVMVLIMTAIHSFTLSAQAVEQGLRVGDKAPEFTLNDQNGNPVTLYSLLKKGPVVLTWYRGGWCPYCNLALKSLAEKSTEFSDLGATFLAISPELPDKTASTAADNKLPFAVLSDINNNVARKYDLVFQLNKETVQAYEKGFGLSDYNGNEKGELPVPATYIIDQKGIIRYAYVNPDYKHRANPDEVLAQLATMVHAANNNKLVLVWSSDDPMLAERVALMFPHAAQKNQWFSDVTLVIWGPSAKLIAENKELQEKLRSMEGDGVKIQACVACANAYGVTDQLKQLGYEVLPMGIPLANYLKRGYRVLTF
ncbi:MAG: redoxin domain-containing protein [Bacteroidales bacterium]